MSKSRFQASQLNVGNVVVIPTPNVQILLTTAPFRSQTAGKRKTKFTCPEPKPQCVERSGKKCTESGDTLEVVLGWVNRVLRGMKDIASCELEVTTSSWSIVHVSDLKMTNE